MQSISRIVVAIVAASSASALMGACSPTTYDDALVADTAPATTTTLPTGTMEQLLADLLAESGALSGVMIADGDEGAAGERIASVWAAVRSDVQAARPDLVDEFDAAVAMCDRAIEFSRAADADKAARNITALVDAVLG